jgi:hypothetical protein
MHTLIHSKQASHQIAMTLDLALLLLVFLVPSPVVRAADLGGDFMIVARDENGRNTVPFRFLYFPVRFRICEISFSYLRK